MLTGVRKQPLFFVAEMMLAGFALWWLGPRVHLITTVTGGAAVAVLLVAVIWMIAAAVEFGFYIAVSWDDSIDLVFASIRAGAQAVWFVPAFLLLAMPALGARVAGLLLVANTTRLLMSRNAPNRMAPEPPPKWSRRYQIARAMREEVAFRRETLPAIAGAMLLQVAIGCTAAGSTLPAAGMAVAGSGLWTWTAIRKGAVERRRDRTSAHWMLGLVLTLLLATAVAAVEIETHAELTGGSTNVGVLETMANIWNDLDRRPGPDGATEAGRKTRSRTSAASKVKPGGLGSDVAPGVIVRPTASHSLAIALNVTPRSLITKTPTVERPVTFSFTGEYRVYPLSTTGRRHDWAIEPGTLLEHMYESDRGGPLETVAEQSIDPPMDFSSAGKVIVLIENGEPDGYTAILELLTGGEPIRLGSEVGGLDNRREDLLEFDVGPGPTRVRALRLSFHRFRGQATRSLQIKVREFTLVPKGHATSSDRPRDAGVR
jgi:hypothetical protein